MSSEKAFKRGESVSWKSSQGTIAEIVEKKRTEPMEIDGQQTDRSASLAQARCVEEGVGLGYTVFMHIGFEFRFYRVGVTNGDAVADATLDLLGSQGWRIAGVTTIAEGVLCALQRPLDPNAPLPDEATLSAALSVPLVAPSAVVLEATPLHEPQREEIDR